MAYAEHLLVNFGGTMGATNPEIWSCGIRLWADSYVTFDEIGYATGVAIPALTDWVNRATSKISSQCSMDWVKVNMIGTDGHYLEPDNPHTYNLNPVVVGEIAAYPLPYQCTVVLSFRSLEASRGLASKGRIYSPFPCLDVNPTTGLFSSTDAAGMALSAALLLNALDITIGGTHPLRPSIMSSTNGAHHQIDSVVVDNRVDTQRRRSNALVPASSTSPITY